MSIDVMVRSTILDRTQISRVQKDLPAKNGDLADRNGSDEFDAASNGVTDDRATTQTYRVRQQDQ
jgi:hypothetical protein